MTNPPQTPRRKGGHPLKPIDLKKVERLAAQGLTQEQIAAALGICVYTLIKRKRVNLDLLEAINRGRAAGIATVTNALFEQATKGKNTAAAIFYLKNRDPERWRDKIELEVEQTLPAALVIEVPCIDVQAEPLPELGTKQ